MTYVPAPSVSRLSVTSSPVGGGSRLTLSGRYFTPSTTVRFCTTPGRSLHYSSGQSISVAIPAHTAGACNVSVQTVGGTSTPSGYSRFSYVARPVASAIVPSNGPSTGGTAVVIRGSGFTGTRSVTFGGAASSFRVTSSSSITATAPRSATTGRVEVRITSQGGTSRAITYTFLAPPPSVDTVPRLAGRVIDSNGLGLKNVEVDVFSTDQKNLYFIGKTAADGRYSVAASQLPQGRYQVCFYGAAATDGQSDVGAGFGYVNQCADGQPWNSRYEYGSVPAGVPNVDIQPGHTVTVGSTLAPAAKITGKVSDVVNGFGLAAGMTLYRNGVVFDEGSTNTTDSIATFAGLAAGDYTVCTDGSDLHAVRVKEHFSPNGYTSSCYTDFAWEPDATNMSAAAQHATIVHLDADSTTEMDLGLRPHSFATLSGTVTATNGDPLAGVDVEALTMDNGMLFSLNGDDSTAEGKFSFNLAVGTYKLCFFAGLSVEGSPGVPRVSGGPSQGGYESQCYDGASRPDKSSNDTDALVAEAKTITVGDSGTIVINPRLNSLSTIAGTVEDPQGAPVGGSVLWLYRDGVRLDSTLAQDDDGTFAFTRIAPGTYTLCLVPQSDAAKAFGTRNRCYDGVVVDSESVAPSATEAKMGTPITVDPGERREVVFSLSVEP